MNFPSRRQSWDDLSVAGVGCRRRRSRSWSRRRRSRLKTGAGGGVRVAAGGEEVKDNMSSWRRPGYLDEIISLGATLMTRAFHSTNNWVKKGAFYCHQKIISILFKF